MKKKKREATQKQLENLKKGREKLFQKQLKEKGIIPNSQPKIVKQTVVNHTTTYNNIKIQIYLFKKFLETKLFPIEINKNKENLNLKQVINYIFSRLNKQRSDIDSNKKDIINIINHLNFKDNKYNEKFKELEKRISDLEKENTLLEKKIREEGRDDAKH